MKFSRMKPGSWDILMFMLEVGWISSISIAVKGKKLYISTKGLR